ncbi:hypothetical protein [Desulforegula conservatrix]|uniref:hypothetical protein n=1 Tax=Desulforegula conservatrix TaxID=153026 RepID=UPI00040C94D9|nr:hypothetical protein [Desulforegula conservatrix]
MNPAELKEMLKKAMEICMPDFRAFYRLTKKARVVKAYESDGKYWADVQPLRNDESVDENEPVVSKVEIPVIWAGPDRGVICPPTEGSYCDLSYYDGDPNYPRISNFRWHGNKAPGCETGAFIIQSGPGCHIKIDAEKNIIQVTPSDINMKAGGSMKIEITGDVIINAGGSVAVTSTGNATVQAAEVSIKGAKIRLN